MTFAEGFWITSWIMMAIGIIWTLAGAVLMYQSEIRSDEIEELLRGCWNPTEIKHIGIGIVTGPPFHILMIIGLLYRLYWKGDTDG